MGHMMVLFLILRNHTVFHSTAPVHTPPNSTGVPFLHILLTPVMSCLLISAILTCVKWYHGGFELHILDDLWCWASFHVPEVICLSSLGNYLFNSLPIFSIKIFSFFLLLSCMSFLHILILTLIRYMVSTYSILFHRLPFILLNMSPVKQTGELECLHYNNAALLQPLGHRMCMSELTQESNALEGNYTSICK